MKWFIKTSILSLLLLSVPVLGSFTTHNNSEETRTKTLLSRHLHLTTQEITQWHQIKESNVLQGFVDLENMSVYEVLAMQTNDPNELKRLARLFAQHNRKIIAKLQQFERIYQQEVKNLQ